ncbi:MAG TPA: ABC transporter ATP-binding protein, partial [Clostridiales bacterium]|nr:ABC transporter ATP-binding protein [Clostridiales bacterium]
DSVTNKILELEHGKAMLYKGNYSYFREEKAKNVQIYEKHYKDQQKEIRRIEAYIALQRK